MPHHCFISFKKEDQKIVDKISELLDDEDIKNKSLDEWIDSDDLDYVMQVIREKYMSNTSVTIYVIGKHSSENEGFEDGYNKQSFVIRELQATLYDGKNNRRSGLLGVVLPVMYSSIYGGSYHCTECESDHNIVRMDDNVVIREFGQNYYLKPIKTGCRNVYNENGRYCVLVKYDDFIKDPNKYIDEAYDKTQEEIAKSVHWRDIEHDWEE
ncbi:MAG: TIR domain-containing protein [Lachnospiraceae bacterium]|jgi:hypothetical protein|nr:TIR domain-containing protein [Lachnospiraceae bacterium]